MTNTLLLFPLLIVSFATEAPLLGSTPPQPGVFYVTTFSASGTLPITIGHVKRQTLTQSPIPGLAASLFSSRLQT
jgi:hypothetical protein